jgi:hypothetical protein
MAISLVWTAENWSTATSGTFSVDVSWLWLAEWDVLICIVWLGCSNNSQNPQISSSWWTEVLNLWSNDTNDAYMSVNWKVMWSTPDTSIDANCCTVTWSSYCIVWAFRWVDTTTPMDVTPTSATYVDWILPTSPAITPTTSWAVVVILWTRTTNSVVAMGSPSWYTEINQWSIDWWIAVTQWMAYKNWVSWTDTPWAWTGTTASIAFASIWATLALRPISTVTINSNFLSFF